MANVNMTAITITAIICVTIVVLAWIGTKYTGKQEEKDGE